MKPFPKVLLLIPLVYFLLLAGSMFVFYMAFIQPGMIWIDVNEHHGNHVYVGVPAFVLNAGLRLVEITEIDHELEYQLRLHHGQHIDFDEWKPAMVSILRELEKYPDLTLVEIEDDRTNVRIVKRNGALRIEVKDPDNRVDIRLPETTMRAVSRMMADL